MTTTSETETERRDGAVSSARDMIEAALVHLENAAGTLAADAPGVSRARLQRAQADLQLLVGELAEVLR